MGGGGGDYGMEERQREGDYSSSEKSSVTREEMLVSFSFAERSRQKRRNRIS